MKYILILNRDGNEFCHRFDASTTEEAMAKSEALVGKEQKERQAMFPFTREPPSEAILFCELLEWLMRKADR